MDKENYERRKRKFESVGMTIKSNYGGRDSQESINIAEAQLEGVEISRMWIDTELLRQKEKLKKKREEINSILYTAKDMNEVVVLRNEILNLEGKIAGLELALKTIHDLSERSQEDLDFWKQYEEETNSVNSVKTNKNKSSKKEE